MPTHGRFWSRAWLDWLLIGVFLAALGMPLAEMYLRLEPLPPGAVKRPWAPATPSGKSRDFGSAFFDYMARSVPEHFGFRHTLIRWHSLLTTRVLGVSGTSQVVLGRHGWMFYGGDRALDDYLFLSPFTEAELKDWGDALELTHQWCRRRGIRFLFVVAPNAPTIYPEFLPARIQKRRAGSRLEQLTGYLSRHTQVEVVDVCRALRAAKPGALLYCKTDTHWNDEGAFVAYQEIAKILQQGFPSLRPLRRDQFRLDTNPAADCDLVRMAALPAEYREGRLTLTPRPPFHFRHAFEGSISSIPEPTLPKAVVFHDSFGEYLKPFLSEHFQRVRYEPLNRLTLLEAEVVEEEKPNAVILEMVERLLMERDPRPLQAMLQPAGSPP